MTDLRPLFVKMALDAWGREVSATSTLLGKLSDDQVMKEVSPGRNRGIYLLGHLTAEHDQMLALLRFQEVMHPELKPVFIDAPDRAVAALPSMHQLREQWTTVNDTLLDHAKRLPPEEWFTRHANISADDFPKEPHRNRLNVLLSRTNHLAYHRGQLVLLAEKG
ncbi:MAG TPA: DinB family protein [Flavobacteriales bacterium]|nr:DinB family protein [Flavobacteriales bacterium]